MFTKFFQKNKNEIAIAFVDYEYWLFSYLNLFGFEPDIQTWHKNLQEHYRNLKIYIFADFSKLQMRKEAESINRIADNVVDICANGTQKPVKDFLMLDSIFRLSTMQGAPDTIILFTGMRLNIWCGILGKK